MLSVNQIKKIKTDFEKLKKETIKKAILDGVDTASKEFKNNLKLLQSKVLDKLGISSEEYNNIEIVSKLTDADSLLDNRVKKLESKIVDWKDISNIPAILVRQDKKDVFNSIKLLSENTATTIDDMIDTFNKKIRSITTYHKDIKNIGRDDHHPEKHILESHLDSPLMAKIKDFLDNPPVSPVRYVQRRSFTQLNDVPATFSGYASKIVAVKSDETGLEFITNFSGTVTSVSVVTANGVSGTVANATTTPAITLSLGAITPSSVTISALTAGSVLIAGTGGLITQDNANLFYDDTNDILKVKYLAINSIQGTEATILALTPSAGRIAWATDLKQFMIADGTNWYVNSAYMDIDLQAPDMGWLQNSNRSGYAKTYITDKEITNSRLGGNANTDAGGLRYNPTLLKVQAYLDGSWETIVSNLLLEEVDGVLEHTPIGFTNRIAVFSGNSDLLGLNGLPITQGYKTSMGAYPVKAQIDGGTF